MLGLWMLLGLGSRPHLNLPPSRGKRWEGKGIRGDWIPASAGMTVVGGLGGEGVWGEEVAAEGGEEVGGVEGAVGAPLLGVLFELGDGEGLAVQVEAGDDASEGQVAGGEGVESSQGA